MANRVLFVDNDPYYLRPLVDHLTANGFDVTSASTVSAAEKLIQNEVFDLLILDVMMPTAQEDELQGYLPSATRFGLDTGIVLYERMMTRLDSVGTKTIVLTTRIDRAVGERFELIGLPSRFCIRKFEVLSGQALLEIVQQRLRSP